MTDEFCLIWFESTQRWVVIFPFLRVLDNGFTSMGYARNAALEEINAADADFDVEEDTGTFYRFVRSEAAK